MKQAMLVIALSISPTVHAIELDYYAYNGFDLTVTSFQRLSLIFNDAEYLYLMMVAATVGILFGALVAGTKAISQSQGLSMTWLYMVLFGVILFKATVLSKGTIHVYDPVRNAYQAVGGVPDLVIGVAGAMNKAERLVAEIVDNGSAHPYKKTAGGVNFQMLLDVMSNNEGGIDDAYLRQSIKRYYRDCTQLALTSPIYNFDLNLLRSGTNDMFTLLGELRTEAVFTRFYETGTKQGVTMSCAAAWDNKIRPELLNPLTYKKTLDNVCTKAGFNIADVSQLASCQSILSDLNTSIYDVTATDLQLLRNASLASAIASVLQDMNPDVGLRALTNRSVITEGIGISQTANEWLPTVRATVTSIVLGLIPLLVVFMVTPLLPKALMATIGLLAWVTFWGIADAFVHQGAMDQALAAAAEIKRHNMGLTALLLTPEAASKALAIFGQARSMGATIASLLAATLLGFSAYALSQVAGTFQSRLESSGTDAANKSITPEGKGKSLSEASEGYVMSSLVGDMGFSAYSQAEAFGKGSSLASSSRVLQSHMASGMSASQARSAAGGSMAGSEIGRFQAVQAQAARNGVDPNSADGISSVQQSRANRDESNAIGASSGIAAGQRRYGASDPSQHSADMAALETIGSASDKETVNQQAERLIDMHEDQTGNVMGHDQAYKQLSEMRLASMSANIQTFGDSDEYLKFMHTNTQMKAFQQAGMIEAAYEMGTTPQQLSQAGGKMQAIEQSGDMGQLSQMSVAEVAQGVLANKILQTQDGVQMDRVLGSSGFLDSARHHKNNEALMSVAGTGALDFVAEATGMDTRQASQAMKLSDVGVAVNSDSIDHLAGNGGLTSSQATTVSEGGNASLTIDPNNGQVLRGNVSSGVSASSDETTSINTGITTGGEASTAQLILNRDNESRLSQTLEAARGDDAAMHQMKMDMANYMNHVNQQTVQETYDSGYSTKGGVGTGIVKQVGVEGSAVGTHNASVSQQSTFNENYKQVADVFSQSQAYADTYAADFMSRHQNADQETINDAYFDAYAHSLHRDMSSLYSEKLEDNKNYVENPKTEAALNHPVSEWTSDRIDDAVDIYKSLKR